MIESHRIEYKLTLTDNFEKEVVSYKIGYSKLISREIMRIYKDLELVEHLGSGLNRILKVYNKDSFLIKDNYMKNIFYSNNNKLKINDPLNDPLKQILVLLSDDNNLSYDDLASILNKSKATVKRNIQKLKTLELIKRVGSDKTGYWKIINEKGNQK